MFLPWSVLLMLLLLLLPCCCYTQSTTIGQKSDGKSKGMQWDSALDRDEANRLFAPIYKSDTQRMRALIDSLSADKLRLFLRTFYAPVGTNKTLTPLVLAAVVGDAEMVQLLLEKGADPNLMCFRKITDPGSTFMTRVTPLWVAAMDGHFEVARVLVKHGANIELGAPEHGHTPLMAACDNFGRLDTVDFLIKNGANVQRTNPRGFTALMAASRVGWKEIVLRLLKAGARPDQMDHDGQTAISIATRSGHTEIAKILRAGLIHTSEL